MFDIRVAPSAFSLFSLTPTHVCGSRNGTIVLNACTAKWYSHILAHGARIHRSNGRYNFENCGLYVCSCVHSASFLLYFVICVSSRSKRNRVRTKRPRIKRKIIMRFADLPHTDQIVFETRSNSNV